MNDFTDRELLLNFARMGDEEAFAELVRRYGGLVFGAALRRSGDHFLAEEASQNVFTVLAQKAPALAEHPALAAWLQKTAAYQSARAVEKENNRRRTMKAYQQEHSHVAGDADAPWLSALPQLDEAISALSEPDRHLILLRYWQGQPFKKIAEAVGGSVAACEKRVERALEKLSRILQRRGVAVTAITIGAGLSTAFHRTSAAPAVLARVTTGALRSAHSAPAGPGLFTSLLLMKSKLTPAAVLAALMALCATAGWIVRRYSSPSDFSGISSSGALASTIAGSPNKLRVDNAANDHRDSLRALLKAAQRDLITANYDPAAKARAAARIARIAPQDIRAALAFADDLIAASGDSSPLTAMVFQRWAEFDGPAACGAALSRKEERFLAMPPLGAPLKVWAARDPQAAFTWYRQKAAAEEGRMHEGDRWKPVSSLRWIMGAWALRDLDGAVRAFSLLTDKSEIDGAMTGFSEMSGTVPGRTAILDVVLSKSDNPPNVWSEFHSILRRWSDHQPAELAAWLDKTSVPQSSHDATATPILTGWLREDAPAAMEWWFNAPGGYPDRAHRMETLISAWTEADVFAAAEWLAVQPLDSTSASSMRTLAGKVAQSDPERGWEWALSIPEAIHRKDALKQVAAAWVRADKAAVTEAVNGATLNEAEKAELITAISTP